MPKIVVVHAFVAMLRRSLGVLQLRDEYQVSATPETNDRGHRRVLLKVERNARLSVGTPKNSVDSVSVLYGDNGGGKTEFLLNICRTFGDSAGQELGVLWEEDGQLFFDPGRQLKRFRYEHGLPIKARSLSTLRDQVGVAFYTTSPFEKLRRSELLLDDLVDVTPSFEDNSPFNGVSLFRAAKSLPQNLDFLKGTKVQLRIAIPRLSRLINDYTTQGLSTSRRRSLKVTQAQLNALVELPNSLTIRHQKALSVDWIRARIGGERRLESLLRQLVDAATDSHPDKRIRDLLARELHGNGDTSSLAVVDAVQGVPIRHLASREAGVAFSRCVAVASRWQEEETLALRYAESLGILRWTFNNLSSGQVAMLMLFASLSGAVETLLNRNVQRAFLLVDEGEMFMHPAWQRRYLSDLINFLERYRSRISEIHLVLSTHSLIVAGDAPPQRLFDVDTGRMRNAFAAGPGELLKTVYEVNEFAGVLSDRLYSRIGRFLREGGTDNEEREVRELIEQIAPKRLKDYLTEDIDRRTGRSDV